MKYFPHTQDDIEQMLSVAGLKSMDELYGEIPEQLLFKREFALPEAMSEVEIRSFFDTLGKKNSQLVCFAGAGVEDHYSPSIINPIISRGEFLTAYTPYQPEISQGTLQYIFEYQSMICELTGMDVTNASMYDGCTATAEAMMMCVAAAKKRNKVLLSATVNPRVRAVVETYAKYNGVVVETVVEKDGVTDLADLQAKLAGDDVAGVILAQPNFYGIIEDYSGVADMCHSKKALMVMNANPSALAVLKTPAEWGADVACGDGQTLGIPMSYGGPYVGYLACTNALVRKLPGRIVGSTTDVDGKRAFVLTLQAREQHIRREKANSNICSNQSLMALYVTIYMSLMGNKGLKEVNKLSYAGAHYLAEQLVATGKCTMAFDKPFLNEFAVKTTVCPKQIQAALLQKGILGGVRIADDMLLLCVTEQRTKAQIDMLVETIKNI
ncbi:MAG: aminomethyl-transferring glycine dehydrogenase subunit GcvPA [Bacteroidaceae bacterium]|nr:aminomethyl-transferring glycine dehydrogenase subunit GcvPA [Bacteroidaceae bacterium]MBQ8270515.1 aminomethyl-transferring glycine dehydrogenase subunit GcvPA [Bacteroidaceae bacterium]